MTIYKRGNSYAAKIRANGQQIWVGTFDTRNAAKKAEAEALLEHSQRPGQKETCEGFAKRWLTEYPRDRNSTQSHYEQVLRQFSKDFEKRPLDSISRTEARAWSLLHPSRHSAVRAMFQDAVNEEIVERNPFAKLRLPASRGRKDIVVLSESEVKKLATTARAVHGAYGKHFYAMVIFAAYTGVRRGELSAIEWGDINLQKDLIRVDKTLSNDREILPPKNGKPRTIFLPPQARRALESIPRLGSDDLIFTTKTGKRFTKSSFHYAWDPVRCSFGRPELAWHELRHFTATHLIQDLRLEPRSVAQQLGHSDAGRLILSLYAHSDEERLLNNIAEAFYREESGPPPPSDPIID